MPNITEPSVCPGACSTSNSIPARVRRVPSVISTTFVGSVHVAAAPNCCSNIAMSPGLLRPSRSWSR